MTVMLRTMMLMTMREMMTMPILAIMTAMTDNNDDSHADVFYDSDGDDDNHEHADDNEDERSFVCHLRGVAEFVIVNILPLSLIHI